MRGKPQEQRSLLVDGTLIESWAPMKSIRSKDDPPVGDSNGWSDFRGGKRSNETHASVTDPESRVARKGPGREAKLSFAGHVLMENRNGLLMDIVVGTADGFAERRRDGGLHLAPSQSIETRGDRNLSAQSNAEHRSPIEDQTIGAPSIHLPKAFSRSEDTLRSP